jgi:hypothetical protein
LTKESSGGWLCPHRISVDTDAPVAVLDLSATPNNAIKHLGIRSVSQLLRFPKKELCEFRRIGAKSVTEVQSKLFNYLSGRSLRIIPFHDGKRSTSLSKSVGTKRLVNAMLNRLTKRQREVIASHCGLWNGTARPLQSIGRKSGLSRQRIHQLEKKGLTRLHGMFGHGVLSESVGRKIGNYLNADPEVKCGVLTRKEAISCIADDCSPEQADKALLLFNDIECSGKELPAGDMLARHLLEVELEVYCVSRTVARCYTVLLKRTKRALKEKPLSESKLRDEILGRTAKAQETAQWRLMERMLSISPSVIHLPDGKIALSRWIEMKGRSAGGRAEVALLCLEGPAHFREISKYAQKLFKVSSEAYERTTHLALLLTPQTFVRVGKGTYGLKRWGLRAAPGRRKRTTA